MDNKFHKYKSATLVSFDFSSFLISVYLASALRTGDFESFNYPILLIFGYSLIAVSIFLAIDIYKFSLTYLGIKSLQKIFIALFLVSFMLLTLLNINNISFPSSLFFINFLLNLFLILGIRVFLRGLIVGRKIFSNENDSRDNVLIFGAGHAGVQLANILEYSSKYNVIAFIDDNQKKLGQYYRGLEVFSRGQIGTLIKKFRIKKIFLAIPSIKNKEKYEILNFLERYRLTIKLLPGISDIIDGNIAVNDIRDVNFEDLLPREKIKTDYHYLRQNIQGKNILVTGAGGSIGSELCRQIIKLDPKILILFDHSESALYEIEKEIECEKVIPVLGSVTNEELIQYVLKKYKIDTLYHAAAYKHVPMLEINPEEGLKNNILGTEICIKSSIKLKVRNFLLVSSDKAVRPTNIMGASKRISEILVQIYSERNKGTKFSIVRFGNVIGSSGSVFPLFKKQLQNGGPLTVTHQEIVRFFMTIPEAVQLVIQAGSMGKEGEVFILSMGQSIRILDLAKKFIHLSGLEVKDINNPSGDIEIKITGLRKGEKLFEELSISGRINKTNNKNIFITEDKISNKKQFQDNLKILIESLNYSNNKNINTQIRALVPEFQNN